MISIGLCIISNTQFLNDVFYINSMVSNSLNICRLPVGFSGRFVYTGFVKK